MAYDEGLASRMREIVRAEPGVTEKRMFGGVAFLVDGNLAASASSRGGLLVRVDRAHTHSLLAEPHVQPFDMRGRAMNGWLLVAAEAVSTEDALRAWVGRGLACARSLPSK
jgi:TfoX/Sxy family transcriptional regulator of competence genes